MKPYRLLSLTSLCLVSVGPIESAAHSPVNEGAGVSATNDSDENEFGKSTSFSGDLARVGALHDGAGEESGSAFVFSMDAISSDSSDMMLLIDLLAGAIDPVPLAYQTDTDRSSVTKASDIIPVMDLLNDAGAYTVMLLLGTAGIVMLRRQRA